MARVDANGLTFHVNRFRTRVGGDDRPVVVCIHGLAVVDNAATAFVVGFNLARHADVYTYDLRGHGRSDRPPAGYRVADHASDLLGLLDALDLSRPAHLVALSYGGAVAMVAAMGDPGRIASVSLLDGHVPVSGWQELLVEASIGPLDRWVDEARASGLAGDQIEQVVVQEVIREFGLPPRRAAAVTRRSLDLLATTTLRHDLHHEPSYAKEDFSRIDCPVLGIYGDRSPFHRLTEVLPTLVRDLTLHTIAGADHLGVFWRPAETRPLVSRFIGLPTGP